jgi:Skp family chaperone for outer membrane proteins
MKNLHRLLLATGLAALLSASVHAADSEPGYIDMGQLVPSAKGEYVEINLSPSLLKFAAKIASKQEPAAAALIGNLKRVRVNVVSLDDGNRKGTIEQMDNIRRKLESQGWTQMVNVREKNGGDNVNVHVKQASEDVIEGLVVTVIGKKGEAVFVNIVGNISADQISEVATALNIDPLKKIHVKMKHRAEQPEEKA